MHSQDCGWGADHGPHPHPGLPYTRCPGLGSERAIPAPAAKAHRHRWYQQLGLANSAGLVEIDTCPIECFATRITTYWGDNDDHKKVVVVPDPRPLKVRRAAA